MVNPLYWVSALVYAIVLIIIFVHDSFLKETQNKEEKAFALLLKWVIFFCIQDMFWGVAGGSHVKSDKVFFIASTIFHLSTVSTTFFWLNYILTYLSDRIKFKKTYLLLDGVVIVFQVVLVITNFFTPTIFYIENGAYVTTFFRPIAFFNQYVVYLVISIVTAIHAFSEKSSIKNKYLSVFAFSLAPVLSGAFQLLYPDGPFYSMGYFLGCFIIHIFVVTRDRDELKQLQNQMDSEKRLSEQIRLANTDRLTNLSNRRSYEEDLVMCKSITLYENFIYVSADVNGLKQINDSKGHAVGDELIKGAADCLTRCFGAYGKVYRIGGDEFAAIIEANDNELKAIKKDFEDAVFWWRGKQVARLSLSYSCVSKKDFPDKSLDEIIKLADEKMYENKAEYYKAKGIDRRGQAAAHTALCNLYTKILKVNITNDSYNIVNMANDEKSAEKGFSDRISEWLTDFGMTGQVHPDDLNDYLNKTNIDFLRDYFKYQKDRLSILYRRKYGDFYYSVIMEIIKADDYTDDNQQLFLYVRTLEM